MQKPSHILCYGDSNTYGFDPYSIFTGRYDADNRWCDILEAKTDGSVFNYGKNGRCLPCFDYEYEELKQAAAHNAPIDTVIIMLGTNDIIMTNSADVNPIAAQMSKLLDFLIELLPQSNIILLLPPPITASLKLSEKLEKLKSAYTELAKNKNITFLDTHSWQLEIGSDGIHLTKEAHHTFADKLYCELCKLY